MATPHKHSPILHTHTHKTTFYQLHWILSKKRNFYATTIEPLLDYITAHTTVYVVSDYAATFDHVVLWYCRNVCRSWDVWPNTEMLRTYHYRHVQHTPIVGKMWKNLLNVFCMLNQCTVCLGAEIKLHFNEFHSEILRVRTSILIWPRALFYFAAADGATVRCIVTVFFAAAFKFDFDIAAS